MQRREQRQADPLAVAARERDSAWRELTDQAHGANRDLGAGLLDALSVVDPADLRVARFFVYALLGPDREASPYSQTGERVQRLAANGIRLVVGELRTDATKTRKDGTRGRLRVDYGDARNPEPAVRWLWRYLDGAKTAGELYGRALVVIAAEQHATRLVLPAGQRVTATRWSSRKDTAAKALAKLTGPHLPASLKRLEHAIEQAHATYEQAEQAHRAAASATAAATADDGPHSDTETTAEPTGDDGASAETEPVGEPDATDGDKHAPDAA